ncbi:unnamed protein product [Lathyrus oleraceus]|uniref:Peroxidase n=1 Tax=Pisum sativum TaxID=3888 RepID=A0A9D4X4R6_PEA|nr:probable peroxidase 26 [Pisum sativum]KAI5413652.1 variant 2, peroxidase 26 [Pisum sativum]
MGRLVYVAFPLIISFAVFSLCQGVAAAAAPPHPNLQWHYYEFNTTCRYAEEYVRHQVKLIYDHDKSITAKLLRLVYSDCFVTGCDASILLDEGPNPEKRAPQNRGLGGFVLIDKIKTVLESRCPGIVSCADILHLAARDAVKMAGAPGYPVFTGRKDGMKSDAASVDLPSPSISWQDALTYFKSRDLDVIDLTTLLGAHTLGQTHCSHIVDRLYNHSGTGNSDPSMDATFRDYMRKLCPPKTKKGQHDPLVFLNPESGSDYTFRESYYNRILRDEAVLEIDQQLLNGDDTKEIIGEFADGFEDFRRTFAESMYKMGNINILTGNQGQIRQNCRFTNKGNPN